MTSITPLAAYPSLHRKDVAFEKFASGQFNTPSLPLVIACVGAGGGTLPKDRRPTFSLPLSVTRPVSSPLRDRSLELAGLASRWLRLFPNTQEALCD